LAPGRLRDRFLKLRAFNIFAAVPTTPQCLQQHKATPQCLQLHKCFWSIRSMKFIAPSLQQFLQTAIDTIPSFEIADGVLMGYETQRNMFAATPTMPQCLQRHKRTFSRVWLPIDRRPTHSTKVIAPLLLQYVQIAVSVLHVMVILSGGEGDVQTTDKVPDVLKLEPEE
jgi:hypothetical protein